LRGESASPYVRSYLLFTRKTWSNLDGQLEQNDCHDTL
jgi:hypothetical protein